MVLKRVGLALVAAVALSACTDDVEQSAVTISDSGSLRVLHHPCGSDNVVSSLRLRVPGGDDLTDADDITLWEVVAIDTRTSQEVETFEPGNIPSGYRETIPLDEPAEGTEVVVNVDVRHGGLGAAHSFVWGTLESGNLVTEDGVKSRPEWLSYAIKGCGGT